MKFDLARSKVGGAAVIAFAGGLLVAGAFDMTPFSHAQQARVGGNTPVISEARGLADFSNSFVAVAEAVTPAVVSIRAESRAAPRPASRPQPQQNAPRQQLPPGIPPGFEEFFRQFPDPEEGDASPTATGTGFVVSTDGYILTNNHVVTKRDRNTRQEKVTVTLNDGRVYTAKIIGNDPETDVAVLKIEADKLKAVAMGDDNSTHIGEWVVAIGNPLGLNFTVTAGIISAKGRREGPADANVPYRISDFLQTDAAINPGNSGGPLLNIRGEVIGINSAIASQTGYYQGYGFAIPITLAHDIMNNLIANGRIRASILGVNIQEVTPEDAVAAGLKSISGVVVSKFSDSVASPAAKAGLQMGDVIIEMNGKPMDRVGTLQRTVRSYQPGTTVEVKAMRFGQLKTFKVKLEERPEGAVASAVVDAPDRPSTPAPTFTVDKLGISTEPLTADWLSQNRVTGPAEGLRVTDVATDRPSTARLDGLIITGYVTSSGKTAIKTEADLRSLVNKTKDGDVITLLVRNIEPVGQGNRGQLAAPFVLNVRVAAR